MKSLCIKTFFFSTKTEKNYNILYSIVSVKCQHTSNLTVDIDRKNEVQFVLEFGQSH